MFSTSLKSYCALRLQMQRLNGVSPEWHCVKSDFRSQLSRKTLVSVFSDK